MQKIIVANLKMSLVLKFEIENWIKGFLRYKQELVSLNTSIVLTPPILSTLNFIEQFKDIKSIAVGLQDSFWERKGSFTGGISASTLKSYGGEYVILGHSERKKYFGETEEVVAYKLQGVSKLGLKSIVCVGETKEEKKKDLTKDSLSRQLKTYLDDFPPGRLDKLILCYEPIWAISTNKPVNPPTADEMMTAKLMMKKFLVEKYGANQAEKVKILYGGSANQHNVEEICFEASMDGVLVGKASLVPAELMGMIKRVEGRLDVGRPSNIT